MEVVNLSDRFSRFSDYFNPRVIGELNDSQVKAVKFHGEFIWHHHDNEDELFLVALNQVISLTKGPSPSSSASEGIILLGSDN